MNLLSNNIGWVLPERCATRVTYDTIKLNGLYVKETFGFTPPHTRGYTHETDCITKPDIPFAINVRNPYAQTVSLWRLHQSLSLQSFYQPYSELDSRLIVLLNELEDGSTGEDINKVWLKFIPSTTSFDQWLNSSNFKSSSYSYKVPEKQPDWIVRTENYEEDVLKVPGITKISKLNPCTAQYYSTFANYLIINSIFNKVYSNEYYLNIIKNNTKIYKSLTEATPRTYPQILLKRLYEKLLFNTTKDIANFIKNIAVVPDNCSYNLVDLATLYNDNWKDFYNQETADLVYNTRREWFTTFNYDKNSWKS